MAIPRTRLHMLRVVDQIRQNLLGLQRDMLNNAAAHKAMAQAQVPDFAKLKTFVDDSATSYLRRLQWLIDLRNDSVKRQRLLDMLALMGWTETDITDVAAPLLLAAIALRDAPRTTYAEIVTFCDQLIVF